jgi:all-trans-8'-apo-beta-carotenal 15,15'-oxygenase
MRSSFAVIGAFSATISGAFGFTSTLPTIRDTRLSQFSSSFPVFASVSEEATSDSSRAATGVVDYEAFANGYKTVFAEVPFKQCSPTVGSIPDDLVGTYYRCGPAMFSAGSIAPPKTSIIQPREGPPVPDGQNPNRMVKHPFEGDGGILGVTFQGDGSQEVTARYRYVRTTAMTNERRKGQRLYKGMDSTREMGNTIAGGMGNDLHSPLFRHHLQPGLNKNRKNTSNTRAIYWGKRLFTMWEGGQPYKLGSIALDTEGRSQLGGVLREKDPFGTGIAVDPVKDRALMYALKQDSGGSELIVYEFNNKFRPIPLGNSPENYGKIFQKLPGLALISDMAATENYAIVVQPPVKASMQFMLNKEPGKVLTVEKAPSTIHLIPRLESKKPGKSFTIPFDGVVESELQLINAYEDGDIVILDAIRPDGSHKKESSKPLEWPWATTETDYVNNASKNSLYRYRIDTKTGAVSKTLLTDTQCSLAVINPTQSTRQHKYIYMAIGGKGSEVAPPQGIARIDTETGAMDSWMPKPYEFCGEPMFARKEGSSNEDDGYILSVLFNGKEEQSELVIFSSSNIGAGPQTRIPLGLGIPHALHGCFTHSEEARWSPEEIERRAKLADKIESRGNIWNEVKSDFSGLGLRFDDMEEYFGDSFLS